MRHQIHDTVNDSSKRDQLSLLAVNRAIIEALNDDIDTPRVLALIDRAFSSLDHTPIDKIDRYALLEFLDTIDELLGLDLIETTPDISDDLKQLLIQRERARDDKDWSMSDEIRDEIQAFGIAIKDTPSGTIWLAKREPIDPIDQVSWLAARLTNCANDLLCLMGDLRLFSR